MMANWRTRSTCLGWSWPAAGRSRTQQVAHSEARDLALAEGDRAQAALSTMYLGQLVNVRGGNSAAERAYREAWSLGRAVVISPLKRSSSPTWGGCRPAGSV